MLLSGCAAQQGKPGEAVKSSTQDLQQSNAHNPLSTTKYPKTNTNNSLPTVQELPSQSPGSKIPQSNFSFPPDASNQTSDAPKLTVYYFYAHYCIASQAINPEIARLEAKYRNSVVFEKYNITEPEAFRQYNLFAAKYNLSNKSRVVPLVYVDGKILVGRFEINDSLEGLMNES